MDVPVDDRDPLEPPRLTCVLGADRGVREDAEASAAVRLRMVAGRAGERVDVVDRAVEHGVDGGDDTAGGEERDLVAAGAERRQLAGVPAVLRRQRLDSLEVVARMAAEDLLLGRRPRLELHELGEQAADLDQVAEPPLRRRALRVRLRLDRAAVRRQEACCAPRVVPEVELVGSAILSPSRSSVGRGRQVSRERSSLPSGPDAARPSLGFLHGRSVLLLRTQGDGRRPGIPPWAVDQVGLAGSRMEHLVASGDYRRGRPGTRLSTRSRTARPRTRSSVGVQPVDRLHEAIDAAIDERAELTSATTRPARSAALREEVRQARRASPPAPGAR